MKNGKLVAFFAMLLITCGSLVAQPKLRDARVDQMHERKWQYLVEQAELSPSEVEMVKPVFLEYENALWKQHEKNRAFFHSVMDAGRDAKPNYAELNDQYAEIEYVQGVLFRNYHSKLKKLLKPETLFRYYKAERDFKRKLLQEFPNKFGGRPPRDGNPD